MSRGMKKQQKNVRDGQPGLGQWKTLGQNPPERWDVLLGEATIRRTAIDDARAATRFCPNGGCYYSWRGQHELCAKFHGSTAPEVPSSPSPKKKPPLLYPNGPYSPSMSPRRRPSLPGADSDLADLSMSNDLYYPSDPLMVRRLKPGEVPTASILPEPHEASTALTAGTAVAYDHIQAERNRLHHAALNFYRSTGRAPTMLVQAPDSSETDRIQLVLEKSGNYRPSTEGSGERAYSNYRLTPSVKLSYAPQKDPSPSDTFFPRADGLAY